MRALALNGRRRIAATSIAALAAWLVSAPSARAEVTATIKYDMVETQVSPHQATLRYPVSVSFRISADKRVDTSASTGIKTRAKLGESTTGVNESGEASTAVYRVVNGAIVITTHAPGYFSVLRIKTNGRTECSATLEYFRNPGHQYIEAVSRTNESVLASNFQAENMTCSIGE
jgi:hypothetical protein